MKYHAHVYWRDTAEKKTALGLRSHLERLGCLLGQVHDHPIGPHPLPMYQVMYDTVKQPQVESFLNQTNLSILLHEDVGEDHVRDHTDGARWINQSLVLNLDFLKTLD